MASVFTKTWLKTIAVIAIAFVVLGWFADKALLNESYTDFQFDAKAESELLSLRLAEHSVDDWQARLPDYEPIYNLHIEGVISQTPAGWTADKNAPGAYFNSLSEDKWQSAIRIAGSDKFLHIVESHEETDLFSLFQFFAPLATVFLLLGVCLYYLSRQIEGPMQKITDGTRALAAGDYSSRIGTGLDEPFASLGHSFDDMAIQIQGLMSDQQVLTGALPHELRTPVSRLRFALDMTRDANSLPKMRDRIANMDHYLDDLENTIESTLLICRLQQGDTLQVVAFDLESLVKSVTASADDNSAVTVSYSGGESIGQVSGEMSLLSIALRNLIENGLRHARSQVNIIASVQDSHTVRVSVEDDGNGIPRALQEKIFVPFARLEKSRSRDSGGVGLGLSIVDLIMRRHGGSVRYESSALGGAAFILEWPLLAPEVKKTLLKP